jgi:hypothetical protein
MTEAWSLDIKEFGFLNLDDAIVFISSVTTTPNLTLVESVFFLWVSDLIGNSNLIKPFAASSLFKDLLILFSRF